MILNRNIWVANAGSNKVVAQNGQHIVPLTEEANPENSRYFQGIIKRGGFVFNHRVSGNLSVARSLGNIAIKYGLNERPKITRLSIGELDAPLYLTLATGELSKALSVEQLAEIAVAKKRTAAKLAECYVKKAYRRRASRNLTAIVVKISNTPSADKGGGSVD